MKQYNPYSSRASLGAVSLYIRQHKIWETVAGLVQIKQKIIRHSPIDKLNDAFINILAGGQGIVEVNTRLRSDLALQRAFGPFRLARYAQFLLREVLPLHDDLCEEEGRLLLAHAAGDSAAVGVLARLKGRVDALYRKLWAG